MRADLTAGQETLLDSGDWDDHWRVKVENGSGTMIDVSDRLKETPTVRPPSPDAPIGTATLVFLRDVNDDTTDSLAPLVDSTYNKLDDGSTFSALFATGRDVTIEHAATSRGGARPADVSTEWHEVVGGFIVAPDWPKRYGDLSVEVMDYAYAMIRRQNEAEYTYTSGTAVETAIQGHLDNVFGAGAYTLVVDDVAGGGTTGSVFGGDHTPPSDEQTWDSLQNMAQSIGWNLWWRYDANGDPELRLEEPRRSKSVADYTFGVGQIGDVSALTIIEEDIRNVGKLTYHDSDGVVQSVTQEDATSIADYGGIRRRFTLAEGEASPIRDSTSATAMLAAIISDLKEPDADHAIEVDGAWWPGEPGIDLYEFAANTFLYDTAQTLAPYRIEIGPGDHPRRAKTTIYTRGQPSAGSGTWLGRPDDDGDPRNPTVTLTELDTSTRASAAVQITGAVGEGGTTPLEYAYKVTDTLDSDDAFSAWAALGGGVTLSISRRLEAVRRLYVKVRDADERESPVAMLEIAPILGPTDGAGIGQSIISRWTDREGQPGLSGKRKDGRALVTDDGVSTLVDPSTAKVTASLLFPGGLAMDTGEEYSERAGAGLETATGKVAVDVDLDHAVANVPAIKTATGKVDGTVAADSGEFIVETNDDLSVLSGRTMSKITDAGALATQDDVDLSSQVTNSLSLANLASGNLPSGVKSKDGDTLESVIGALTKTGQGVRGLVGTWADREGQPGLSGKRKDGRAVVTGDGVSTLVDPSTAKVTASLLFPSGMAMDDAEGYAGRARDGLDGSGFVTKDVDLDHAVANVPALDAAGKLDGTVQTSDGKFPVETDDDLSVLTGRTMSNITDAGALATEDAVDPATEIESGNLPTGVKAQMIRASTGAFDIDPDNFWDANERLKDQTRAQMITIGNRRSVQTNIANASLLVGRDANSDAEIEVSGHDLRIGGSDISYTGDTITGLSFETRYYVYADDPTFAGGAVTYVATTDFATAMAADGRYYVGTVVTPANGGLPNSGTEGGGGELPPQE